LKILLLVGIGQRVLGVRILMCVPLAIKMTSQSHPPTSAAVSFLNGALMQGVSESIKNTDDHNDSLIQRREGVDFILEN
jgi:hypothetical protein